MKYCRIIKLLLFVFILNMANSLKTEFLSRTKTSTNSKSKTHNKSKNKTNSSGRINMSELKMKLHKFHDEGQTNPPTVVTPTPPQVAQPTLPIAPTASAPQTVVPSANPVTQVTPTPECEKTTNPLLQPIKGDGSENSDILFTSWIKYFKLVDMSTTNTCPPKSFYKNNSYYEQLKLFPGIDMTKMSSDGVNTLEEFIKKPSYFYAVMFPNNLNILTSRQV
jgi:hypothetical protein